MLKRALCISGVLTVLLVATLCTANPYAKRLYKKGEKYLAGNDNHRAYLVFRELARDYPSSDYADDAHFLIAHYYLQNKDYFQAENEFLILIKNYPDSPFVKDAKEYFSRMRSRSLEDKVSVAMSNGDYKTAKIFLEEMLTIDPTNTSAKAKLKEVDNILVKMDYQRQQFEKEKERLEEESDAIKQAREELHKLQQEAELAMERAEEATKRSEAEYNAHMEEVAEEKARLEAEIARLESELNEWRERAKKAEATLLAQGESASAGSVTDPGTSKVLFEGLATDPDPSSKEKSAQEIIDSGSPSVILISEREDPATQMTKAELVLSLDLSDEWPERHYLKFRIDYTPLPAADESGPKPTVIYYTAADMDDMDSETTTYKKKVIVAIDRKRVQEYCVTAFFVERQ
jgi:TolA-binding protein